jgi:hypothetical protein
MSGCKMRWAAVFVMGGLAHSATAQLGDFTTWTLLEDPPHPLMDGSVTVGAATLTAGDGMIPAATDIGYASVDEATVATSAAGHYFDKDADLSAAIDFDLSFLGSPEGGIAVGFGVGEDADGANSAGIVSLVEFGTLLGDQGTIAQAGRVGNADAGSAPIAVFTTITSGSLFVAYTAATGTVDVGIAPTTGATSATITGSLPSIQNGWNEQDLLLSFFLRSDGGLGGPWSAGEATAVFSNLRVLDGEAIAVPEPSGLTLLAMVAGGLLLRRRLG